MTVRQESRPLTKEALASLPKFDEFGELKDSKWKKRLDYFVVELRSVPSECGYIIEYRNQRHPEKVLAWAKKAKKYLIASKGIGSDRVVIADGGYSDEFRIELRLGPLGSCREAN